MGVGAITLDDSQQNEVYDYYSRMLERPPEEVGFFDGALTSPFKGFEHAVAVGSSAALATDLDAMPDFIQSKREDAYRWMSETRADPKTMGTLAQIGHSIGSVIGMGIAGAPLGVPGSAASIGGLSAYDKYSELRDNGVDHQTALKAAGLEGVIMAAGAGAPAFLGKKLLTQMASGAAINVGLGAIERGGTAAILENAGYAEMAKHYKVVDETAMAIDAILGGMVFPVGARMIRRAPPGERPTREEIDMATLGSNGIAERMRDPVLQTTLEGMDRRLAADLEVTRQIIEEGRPLHEVTIPPGLADDVIQNPVFEQAAVTAAKAIDDEFTADGVSVEKIDSEISLASDAMREADDAVQEAGLRQRPGEAGEAEARLAAEQEAQFTNSAARAIVESSPDMRVFDDMGVEKSAKELLDEADQRFEQEKRESILFKIAVSCAIGAGE